MVFLSLGMSMCGTCGVNVTGNISKIFKKISFLILNPRRKVTAYIFLVSELKMRQP